MDIYDDRILHSPTCFFPYLLPASWIDTARKEHVLILEFLFSRLHSTHVGIENHSRQMETLGRISSQGCIFHWIMLWPEFTSWSHHRKRVDSRNEQKTDRWKEKRTHSLSGILWKKVSLITFAFSFSFTPAHEFIIKGRVMIHILLDRSWCAQNIQKFLTAPRYPGGVLSLWQLMSFKTRKKVWNKLNSLWNKIYDGIPFPSSLPSSPRNIHWSEFWELFVVIPCGSLAFLCLSFSRKHEPHEQQDQ